MAVYKDLANPIRRFPKSWLIQLELVLQRAGSAETRDSPRAKSEILFVLISQLGYKYFNLISRLFPTFVKSFEHSILDVSQGLNIQSETRLSDCGDGMWANGGTRMGGRTPLPLAHSSQILPGMKVRMKSGHWDGQSDLKVTVKGTRPSALGMSDPVMESLEILGTPEFSNLWRVEGYEGENDEKVVKKDEKQWKIMKKW